MEGNATVRKPTSWKDFPDFYANDFVRRIAGNEKWTISDKDKRPIDMHALLTTGKIWGVAYTRGYNPLVDLQTLIQAIPNCTNNAYHLEAETDKFVVLDIEPKCPAIIKEGLLKLPWLYGETSMSGKGLHLVFELPQDIWDKYPAIHNKMALKEEHGYYEILLDHMVTFTRNTVAHPEEMRDIEEFSNVFERLASITKETQAVENELVVDEIDSSDIPMFDRTIHVLSAQTYKKTAENFNGDNSAYEFGMCGFYRRALQKLLKNPQYSDIHYDEKQEAIILYTLLTSKLEHRAKHDTTRNGMPWLMFIITQCILKSDLQPKNPATEN